MDRLIMPYIDLCNIACGGHAGSAEIIKRTIDIAIENDVEVGAHPGYADKTNFGRKYIGLTEQELKDLLRSQIDFFLNIADQIGIKPHHIKPHGALYHACNHRVLEKNILIELLKQEYSHLTLLVFANSQLHSKAEAEQLTIMTESFIDREYTENLKLSARKEEGSTIFSAIKAKTQYENLSKGRVVSKGGVSHALITQTACIHGDNPFVLDILESIHL